MEIEFRIPAEMDIDVEHSTSGCITLKLKKLTYSDISSINSRN